MAPEIITAAAGILGKIAADPAKASAMRRTAVIKALKALHLDPHQPPKDFDSLYAYALVEELHGRPEAVLRLFQDQYVQGSFKTSFNSDDWSTLKEEIDLAVERNVETREFGHFGTDIDETLIRFIAKFQELVDRSRDPHATRIENKVDRLLDEVEKARSAEEAYRLSANPERAHVSAAERLRDDAEVWFRAVGYRIDKTWNTSRDHSALLIDVPTRRPGRFDRVVVLCVEGELGLHHLDLLDSLTQEEEAAEGWGVSQLRVSEAARRKAADSEDRLSCYSFDELIELEVDFEPYIDWLQSEVKSRMIDTRYVPLSCRKDEVDPTTGKPLDVSNYHWENGGLDRYVETWLTDPTKKHLSLLGEFGMGKSWFSLHFASKLAQAWKDAKNRGMPRPRIPLVIPLRDYAKQTSVSALLSEFFFNKHKIGLRSYDVFSVLNRMGRLLLIFDGFDEMASRIDRNTMVSNFWELAKAVEPGAKVLLSSRTEHFPEAKEARDLFEARVSTSSSGSPADGPTFEIVELVPFDDVQIEQMLGHLLGEDKVQSVMSNEDVRDLMRRPVMSELVIDALPEIESGAPVNLTRVYLYAIKRKMDRDVTSQRTFTSRADKLFFLSEISWNMLRTNELTLNFRDFPDKLRDCFGPAVESSKDLDYWEQDMRSQGMLVRNAEGDYGPSHKSLLEFFTAYKYVAELGLLAGDYLGLIPRSSRDGADSHSWSEHFALRQSDGSLPDVNTISAEPADRLAESFGRDDFNPVVYDFLASMIQEHPHFQSTLLSHIESTRSLSNCGFLGGNCANLLGHAGGTLEGADLRGVDLTGFRKVDLTQPNMSLRGTDLRGAALESVNLSAIDKRGADFSGVALKESSVLVSARSAGMAVDHPDGAITALVMETTTEELKRSILRWPTGDLSSSPEVTSLPAANDAHSAWWDGVRIFPGQSEKWWGYSDGTSTFLVSGATQEVTHQFDGCASQSIMWADREALVFSDISNPGDVGWNVVDVETREVLASPSDVDDPGAISYSFFQGDAHLRVWLQAHDWTKIYKYSPGQSDWVLEHDLSIGAGDRLSDETPGAHVLESDGILYTPSQGGELVQFPKKLAEPVLPDLIDGHKLSLSPDRRVAITFHGYRMIAWNSTSAPWERMWSAEFGGFVRVCRISAKNSRVIALTQSGELFSYALESGELLSAHALNHLLVGAKFSHDSGLSPVEVQTALRAGAVVESA
ncbi:NACHT domain-containing protein [Streptomyces sp. NBC_00853]|uniref:NACHT domain-containing protein n=1 Tax=Streptomyces sp. NBC_00853 TaxID=2903681 RepID=UPI003872B06C|nr:NACHT domain-containing protein [Streptomyces sp. NBC_00853]